MLINCNHGTGLIVIPKAASNTIMDGIRISGLNWIEVSAQEFEQLPHRYAFVREPHERAASAYNMYCRTGCGRRHDMSSFENFILGVCARDDNDPHVIPQVRLCRPKGVFLPQRVIKWDFDEMAKLLGIEKMPHNNRGDHSVEWSDVARAKFDETFADDLAMWSGQ